jgi:hypothetical protein
MTGIKKNTSKDKKNIYIIIISIVFPHNLLKEKKKIDSSSVFLIDNDSFNFFIIINMGVRVSLRASLLISQTLKLTTI